MAKNDRVLIDGIVDDRIAARLPSDKRDEAFEFLVFEQLLKDFDLSKDEIESGTLDGRQDGGIDGLFIFVNGHFLNEVEAFVWPKTNAEVQVFIITCKHHDTFRQATLDNLAATISELFDFGIEDESLKGAYSKAVVQARTTLRYAYRKLSSRLSHFSIRAVYASRGDTSSIGDEVRARANQIQGIIQDQFGRCEAAVSFVGSAELVELHRKAATYSLELPFVEALARGERYVVLAKLADYYRFVSDNGKLRRYLFDSNVRDFMGLNRVNEDIRATLASEKSPDFWWLNNGVTILATSASVVGKSIQLQDIQIVNGLQTTESIYRYMASGGTDPAERCILVKVVVARDDAIRDAIIRATNNQTSVELASLHATDKIQRDIEETIFRHGLFYERRKNHYVNLGHSLKVIVTPHYVAAGYVSLVLKNQAAATSLRSKFMRSSVAYDAVFSVLAPLEVWPKIAHILKNVDAGLELLRPKTHGTERFLKSWRQVIAFLAVSKLIGRFDYSISDLLKLDSSKVDDQLVLSVWTDLRTYSTTVGLPLIWTSRANVLAACKLYGKSHSLAGFQCIGNWSLPHEDQTPKTTREPLTQDIINRIRTELPAQPWKPGLHKKIAAAVGCTIGTYFAAVESLIDQGLFYTQRDGVLFDPEGNIVGFDQSRVDPETMTLRIEEA